MSGRNFPATTSQVNGGRHPRALCSKPSAPSDIVAAHHTFGSVDQSPARMALKRSCGIAHYGEMMMFIADVGVLRRASADKIALAFT